MDGEITIGTKLDTDKFDRQITQLEKKMKKEENKKIEKEVEIADLQKSINQYDEAEKKVIELTQKLEDLRAERQKIMQQGDFRFVTPQGTVGFSNEYKDVEREIQKANTDLIKQTEIINSQGGSIDKNRTKLEKIKEKHDEISQKVSEYKQKIAAINLQKTRADVESVKSSINGVGSFLESAIKKTSKLALGIFGIRSAYLGIRQAISTLSEYNDGLANKIEAIKLSLITAIEPIVNFIVNVVGKIVSFLGYILKNLFGIDIFARATALNFNKMQKGANGTTKAVKELKKQLAGFDELNVLNEDGTTGITAKGVGVADLSKDLSDLNSQGEIVAKNLKKWFLGSDKTDIKGIWEDNLKIIKNFLGDMKKAFEPLGKWVDSNVWKPIKDYFRKTMKDLEPLIKPLKKAFKDVVTNVKPYWTSFKNFFKDKIIKPIKNALSDLGKIFYDAFTPYINKAIRALNVVLKPFGKEIKEINVKTTKSQGGGFRAKGGIFYPSLLPKLASGGIINMPRKRFIL